MFVGYKKNNRPLPRGEKRKKLFIFFFSRPPARKKKKSFCGGKKQKKEGGALVLFHPPGVFFGGGEIICAPQKRCGKKYLGEKNKQPRGAGFFFFPEGAFFWDAGGYPKKSPVCGKFGGTKTPSFFYWGGGVRGGAFPLGGNFFGGKTKPMGFRLEEFPKVDFGGIGGPPTVFGGPGPFPGPKDLFRVWRSHSTLIRRRSPRGVSEATYSP